MSATYYNSSNIEVHTSDGLVVIRVEDDLDEWRSTQFLSQKECVKLAVALLQAAQELGEKDG